MSNYRKLIVAVIGLALTSIDHFTGFTVAWDANQILTTVIIPVATAFGVWASPNDPA